MKEWSKGYTMMYHMMGLRKCKNCKCAPNSQGKGTKMEAYTELQLWLNFQMAQEIKGRLLNQ